MPSDRKKLLEEYNRLKAIVQRFDEKGLHDTCHHTDLARVKAALFPKRKRKSTKPPKQEEGKIILEGDQDNGE